MQKLHCGLMIAICRPDNSLGKINCRVDVNYCQGTDALKNRTPRFPQGEQKVRIPLLPIIFITSVLTSSTAAFAEQPFHDKESQGVVNIAVFGDSPYGTAPADTSQFDATPAFIDAINADRDVSLVLHVGDIHSGKQYCTEAYDRAVYDLWTAFLAPVVYTPGDNEWTDCHKTGEGGGSYNPATGQIVYKRDTSGNLIDYAGGDPIMNLDLVRSIFFARPGHAIGGDKRVLSQSLAFDRRHPSDRKYVENVMWEQSKVLFVTLNIPGGSNNDSDIWYGEPTMSAAQSEEIAERTGADLRWLDAVFARARDDDAKAVVIQIQADMWDLDGKPPSHIDQYKQFIDRIASKTADFGKPVLLFNGDSHHYRSDNPLVPAAPCVTESSTGADVACGDDAYENQPHGYNVPNFHRVVVHGSTFPLEWLKLTIIPRAKAAANSANAFGPFNWQRMRQQ